MGEITEILIPAFATDTILKTRCDNCGEIGKWWTRSAGARLDSENSACFFVTL